MKADMTLLGSLLSTAFKNSIAHILTESGYIAGIVE
jgi:hypothetical protein